MFERHIYWWHEGFHRFTTQRSKWSTWRWQVGSAKPQLKVARCRLHGQHILQIHMDTGVRSKRPFSLTTCDKIQTWTNPLSIPCRSPVDPLKGPYLPFKGPLVLTGSHKTDITFLAIFGFSITFFWFFQTIWDGDLMIDAAFFWFWRF